MLTTSVWQVIVVRETGNWPECVVCLGENAGVVVAGVLMLRSSGSWLMVEMLSVVVTNGKGREDRRGRFAQFRVWWSRRGQEVREVGMELGRLVDMPSVDVVFGLQGVWAVPCVFGSEGMRERTTSDLVGWR